MEKLIITPKTKIHDLLEQYPQLEQVLIRLAPQFKKLQNPVLRRTVARITNLNQAATIGGLKVEKLVSTLRKEVGQDDSVEGVAESSNYVMSKPEWFQLDNVVETIDIREMLDRGEQPVHEVLSTLKKLRKGEILKVIAPFLPAPLIDKTLSLDFLHWIDKQSEQEYSLFFTQS